MTYKTRQSVVALIMLFLLAACSTSRLPITAKKHENVILVHGLGKGSGAMNSLAGQLEKAGYDTCRLNYKSLNTEMQQVFQQTNKQVEDCIAHHQKNHFVGHSLGGLVIQHYLSMQPNIIEKSTLGEVVLIGTPNNGSEVADKLEKSFVMSLVGEVPRSLTTASVDVWTSQMPKQIEVGVIAGTNDSMLTNHLFSGPNDGVVSVESAKNTRMKDFISVDLRHANLRRDSWVAEQVIHFVSYGVFNHKTQ